jgi:hypothetical protein
MKTTLAFFILILVSCAIVTPNKSRCRENKKFKEVFFYHIEYVDNHISSVQDSTFRKSIIFLSNYVPISTNRIMNYARIYPISIYEKDRAKLIEWYELNKCTNIQFKQTYTIPEAYMK